MKHKNLTVKLIMLLVLSLIAAVCMTSTYPMLASANTTSRVQYTIEKGDTLFLIAQKFGISIDSLRQVNGLKSDIIMPGQVLRISGSNASIYIVKSGDSLYKISQRFGLSVNYLKWANSLKSYALVPGQTLKIPGKKLIIVIDKSDHTLALVSEALEIKSYHVEFGDGGTTDKQIAGDHKTPEGTFYVAEKSVLNPADYYLGTRWMRISYPNIEDANRGLEKGLINKDTFNRIVNAINNKQIPPQHTALGGGVGIHGGGTLQMGSDWTWGCIGLSNKNVEDFFNYVNVGTPIIIQK